MPEVLVATPLQSSLCSKGHEFKNGISIRELSPIRWDISSIKRFISEKDLDEFKNTKYWLCAAKSLAHTPYVYNDLTDAAHHAALALQILCPTGAKHQFLTFEQTSSGWNNIGWSPGSRLYNTHLGRIINAEQQGLTSFNDVYEGIREAFAKEIVRIQNPVRLLERGMQANHTDLGSLMFVMGLDMLMMAGEGTTFISRLGGFLGPTSLIFPRESIMRLQPRTTVTDVLKNLWAFRNKIAHGLELPKVPYCERYELLSTCGNRVHHVDYYYRHLMHESALFMLTTALRRVFTDGLLLDVADPKRWRRKLKAYERCSESHLKAISKETLTFENTSPL